MESSQHYNLVPECPQHSKLTIATSISILPSKKIIQLSHQLPLTVQYLVNQNQHHKGQPVHHILEPAMFASKTSSPTLPKIRKQIRQLNLHVREDEELCTSYRKCFHDINERSLDLCGAAVLQTLEEHSTPWDAEEDEFLRDNMKELETKARDLRHEMDLAQERIRVNQHRLRILREAEARKQQSWLLTLMRIAKGQTALLKRLKMVKREREVHDAKMFIGQVVDLSVSAAFLFPGF